MKESKLEMIYIERWLNLGILLILIMITIGGITRLTNSGLSMVDWKLISGAIPPLDNQDWIDTFEKYKQFPEYKKINKSMSLSEFKFIFWWEYLHRVWGRLIGLCFILPYCFFLFKGYITKKLNKKLIVLLLLGSLQAFFGWFMVKSGLVDVPDVSHFRLSLHLITAFSIIGYIYWILMELKGVEKNFSKKINRASLILLIFLLIQICYGGFVAGLKAGYFMLDQNNFVKTIFGIDSTKKSIDIFNNAIDIQAFHRLFAWIVLITSVYIYKICRNTFAQNVSKRILVLVSFQILLGIITIISRVKIEIALIHQILAVLLLTQTLRIFFISNKKFQ